MTSFAQNRTLFVYKFKRPMSHPRPRFLFRFFPLFSHRCHTKLKLRETVNRRSRDLRSDSRRIAAASRHGSSIWTGWRPFRKFKTTTVRGGRLSFVIFVRDDFFSSPLALVHNLWLPKLVLIGRQTRAGQMIYAVHENVDRVFEE